jgi:lysophospholipase L1-like esterase
MPQTLVLLGDSILDNHPYTRPAPDTTAHLQRLLTGWSIRRVAIDGSRMRDIEPQLRALQERPSLAVLSVGGNDAIEHVDVLDRRASSSAEVLRELLAIADRFAQEYEAVARAVRDRVERTVLCTIYEVQLEPAPYAALARVPLALLNDRIVRTAAAIGADVLELRSVCTEPADFVRQIEPSPQGAAKIARAIAEVAGAEAAGGSRIFAANPTA